MNVLKWITLRHLLNVLLTLIGTRKSVIGNATRKPATQHLLDQTGTQKLVHTNVLKQITLRHLLNKLLYLIGKLTSAIGNAIKPYAALQILNLTGTQQLAHTNALKLIMQYVHKRMQDGLGTLVNASVNVLLKPALIYKHGTKQLVLAFQRLQLRITFS